MDFRIGMTGSRLMKLAGKTLAAATAALLGGCLHLQLGGAVTEATVTVTPLRDSSVVIERLRTPSLEEVRQQIGPDKWDSKRDIGRFVMLGNVVLDESLYEPDELYLVTAGGGLDYDANYDNVLDDEPTAVFGQWHAIMTGEQLSRGKVSPLTEAIYRYLQLNLNGLSDAAVIAKMDELADVMVADTNRSGSVDYEDVLFWHRHFNAREYIRGIELLDNLSAAIREDFEASEVRKLAADVVGREAESEGPFTISGVVGVPTTSRLDGDVNDTNVPEFSNDSFGEAQPLDNPVVLGGFVTRLPTNVERDRFFQEADLDDFYRINLLKDQLITLVIAEDTRFNDLDLYLYSTPDIGSPDRFSLSSVEEVEQIVVPEDGEYWIRVAAFSGTSNYQLIIGIGEPSRTPAQLNQDSDFIPGQVIARFRDRPNVSTMLRRARFTKMRIRGGGLRRANLLELARAPGERLKQRKLKTILAMKRLRQQAEVETAGLNFRVYPTAVPNDPFYNQQRWHYEQINLPLAWDRSLGDDTIVAVLDTGIRSGHPDMQGQLVQGWDFFDVNFLGDRGDSNPEDPGDSEDGTPSSFHGTHVAGTVAAASNNGSGVAGVAWNAKIMPVRVLGAGGGTNYGVLQGVRYAAGLENDSETVPERPADVINMSLAGGGFNAFDQSVYNEVAAKGIIVVAAAGNDSSREFAYPASYDNVISVSATNINRSRAPYSNFGSRVDVAAPGGDSFTPDVNGDGVADMVLSTGADDTTGSIQDNYRLLQGTSMASPHVAGVMALMKSLYPALTPVQVEAALSQGLLTDDLGTEGRDDVFGWGLINANKAVLVAQSLRDGGEIELIPAVTTSASSLNFGTFATLLPLTVGNAGTGVLAVTEVSVDEPWLSIDPVDIDENGVGVYNVRVDREQLEIGAYSADISISTNDRDVTVQVIVQEPDPSTLTEGNAGTHYILLIDANAPGDSPEKIRQAIVNPVNGVYPFSFEEIPQGSYQLIGGSDIDNDFLICDQGESCGAWPLLDSDLPIIEVIQDLESLNFSSTFNTGIISSPAAASATAAPTPGRAYRRSSYTGTSKDR